MPAFMWSLGRRLTTATLEWSLRQFQGYPYPQVLLGCLKEYLKSRHGSIINLMAQAPTLTHSKKKLPSATRYVSAYCLGRKLLGHYSDTAFKRNTKRQPSAWGLLPLCTTRTPERNILPLSGIHSYLPNQACTLPGQLLVDVT